MDHDEEQLFQQLANDMDIAAALSEHEAACAQQPAGCPICEFFNTIHQLRHFAEVFDPGKLVELATDLASFLDDTMVISHFLTDINHYFIMEKLDWDLTVEEDEEDEEDEKDS